jgi:hypothetical protein
VQADDDADALHPHAPHQPQPSLDDLFWKAALLRGDVREDTPLDSEREFRWLRPSEAEIALGAARRMSDAIWTTHVNRIELAGEIWNVEQREHHPVEAYCAETDVRPRGTPHVRFPASEALNAIWFFPNEQRFVLELPPVPLIAWTN